jgi:predicted MFS family arabinose efflux permease
MTIPNTTFPAATVAAASRATYAAFIGAGFAFASWASRIPQVRDQLELSSAELGLLLLAIAVGSLIALPLAGVIVHRLGSRRTVTAMAVLLGVGLLTVALGYLLGVVPVVIGLCLVGFANGAWDVAMNVQGASVEQHLGRSIMSRYHAGFSLGTVAGAGIGAVMVLASVPVTAHLLVVAIGTAVVIPLAVRGFLPDVAQTADRGTETAEHRAEKADRGGVFRRWLEPRTLLIGVFVFAFAFAEGTGNDWIAVSLIDGYQASAAAGTVGFAVFLTAMTAGRWFGPNLLDRYGRVAVVRTLAVVATGGLLVFIFSPSTPLAFVGIGLWGAGTSLGFPVGMSAAADDPAAAAGRVSVVASIGYCAFLAGPPLIGFLGEQAGVLKALTVVAGLLAVAALVAAALRPLPTAGRPRPAASDDGNS